MRRSEKPELPESCDLLVVGSGAAGMAAALSAAHHGLKPVIIEKSDYFGGSTAVSGGAIWVPCNPLAEAAGMKDDPAAARRYIQGETGNLFNAELVDAFLARGPEAIGFFHEKTALQMAHRPVSPDYHPEADGATEGGRALDAFDFDGRKLGDELYRLRPPYKDFTILGGMPLGRPDIFHFLRLTRSAKSALYATKRVMRYFLDRLTAGRNTRLVMGAAVAGRLAHSVFAQNIPLCTGHELLALIRDPQGRVCGAKVKGPKGVRTVTARRGVVLAAGGFAHDQARRNAVFDHVRRGLPHYSMSPVAGTGGAIAAAEAVGAAFVDSNPNGGFWTPVSLLPNEDGTRRPFPHLFLDRAKPGVIAVGHDGRRFVNEASSYHDFVQGLIAKLLDEGQKSAWLIADHRAVRRYGLGAAHAFPASIRPHLKSGYLKRADSLAGLAKLCGIAPDAFEATVAGFNAAAARGEDPAFNKGATTYQRYLGDMEHRPNACLRPLQGPFYAIEIFAGDIGTSMGLAITARGEVKDREGAVIDGLYACGNDINSIMSGSYPGPGITLGPALTFGYIIGQQAANQAG
ncbi:FAD-dependent oxidoreductase [Pseudogemmobacter faecipullorum]|uniref:FAD-dependent oxidoreductase n=1 Tax=Pseudogemmobacter faecipullorum TaxID=2755041 RepID=A0ABS8CLZ2_9RHOB|nr:FAD-dependent oxidoreductase [Pseudogemmobacter faecipullorum]MCB5410399.1 FAD-dependent oxidoreductase [Pseudogemmobacter faecipullorum]